MTANCLFLINLITIIILFFKILLLFNYSLITGLKYNFTIYMVSMENKILLIQKILEKFIIIILFPILFIIFTV